MSISRINFQIPQIFGYDCGVDNQMRRRRRVTASSNGVWCGLRRGENRKPMWRKSFMSTEAIQAVQMLKLANKNNNNKLEHVFSTRLTRLLKADLLDTLAELQRQNHLQLALQVFEFARKEAWYEPDLSLYCDMMLMMGKSKMIEGVEQLFFELKREGLEPDTRVYTEMIGAYFRANMLQKAMEMYDLMKSSGCVPDRLTITILLRNLINSGEEELIARLKKDFADHMDFPYMFREEVDRKYLKRSSPTRVSGISSTLSQLSGS